MVFKERPADMLINVILDRSGSMGSLVDSVIEHFNGYKEEVSNLEDTNVNMSIFQFDDKYETIVYNTPVEKVPDLTREVYYSRGSTALLDAIGRTINTIDAIVDKPSKIVIVVNTDGYENSSKEFTQARIKELVEDKQKQDWQFVFVGAGVDAFTTGTSYGFYGASTYTTTQDSAGIDASYRQMTNSTVSYASGASATMDMSIPLPEEEKKDTIDDKINKRAKKVKSESR